MLTPAPATVQATPTVTAAPAGDPLRASVQVMALPPGAYHGSVRPNLRLRQVIKGVTFPCAQFASLPEPGRTPLQFLTPDGLASSVWLAGPESATFFVTPDSGPLVVTTYTLGNQLQSCLSLDIRRIDAPLAASVELSLTAHIQRLGDRRFASGDWASAGDNPYWIEGFSVDGASDLAGSLMCGAINAASPAGAWVAAPAYAGTRGRGLPLLGVAFRLTGEAERIYRVAYTARFLRHGEIEGTDGSPCRSPLPQDPLIALRVTLIPR